MNCRALDDEDKCGVIDQKKVDELLSWLRKHGLEDSNLESKSFLY
jgi:hypothetical protein